MGRCMDSRIADSHPLQGIRLKRGLRFGLRVRGRRLSLKYKAMTLPVGKKPAPTIKAFMYLVDPDTQCWVWQGPFCAEGRYGRIPGSWPMQAGLGNTH